MGLPVSVSVKGATMEYVPQGTVIALTTIVVYGDAVTEVEEVPSGTVNDITVPSTIIASGDPVRE